MQETVERIEVRAGDPFYAAATYMVPSERGRALRNEAAKEYRRQIRRLMALRIAGPDEEEE